MIIKKIMNSGAIKKLFLFYFVALSSIAGGFFLATGCDLIGKEDQEPTINTQVSSDKVIQAYFEATQSHSGYQLTPKDFVLYEENLKIENSPVEIVMDHSYTFENLEKKSTEDIFYFTYQGSEYKDNSKTVGPTVTEKFKIQTSQSQMALRQFIKPHIKPQANKLSRVTLHKLSSMDKSFKVSSCNQLPNCEAQGKELKFDLILWYDDGSYHKMQYRGFFSPQLPAALFQLPAPSFGGLFNIFFGIPGVPAGYECMSEFVMAGERRVFITRCTVLRQFQYATE